jgi:hypothetical protein
MLTGEWANKVEIALELSLSTRRVLGLAREHKWTAKPGPKVPGQRMPQRLFLVSDVLSYQNGDLLLADGTLPPPPDPTAKLPKYCFVALDAAAKHIRVPLTVIEQACDSGLLCAVSDGKGGRLVRIRDVEECNFASATKATRRQ